MARRLYVSVIACAFILHAAPAWTQGAANGAAPASPNAVIPGELVIEPPTLINLGFEWFIQGDANRNAAVAVTFR